MKCNLAHVVFDVRPALRAKELHRMPVGLLLAAIAFGGAPASIHAAAKPEPTVASAKQPDPKSRAPSKSSELTTGSIPRAGAASSFRATVRALVEQEVQKTGLPADIAEAVVHVESNYDPTTIGGVGEIGLMQIRPETAAMLGFKGSNEDLAKPETNIHYGVIYLSKAWRLANGDLCRALMKYRAGHGEEKMTPLSVTYCNRARTHLAALGSPFATIDGETPIAAPPSIPAERPASIAHDGVSPKPSASSPKAVYARYRQGTPAASRAFWAAHDARVHAITARLEAKWHRVASR